VGGSAGWQGLLWWNDVIGKSRIVLSKPRYYYGQRVALLVYEYSTISFHQRDIHVDIDSFECSIIGLYCTKNPTFSGKALLMDAKPSNKQRAKQF
jgi:hypothetical protein